MNQDKSIFAGTINVNPPIDLELNSRSVGSFLVFSTSPSTIEARSSQDEAVALFRDPALLVDLELLAWDLLWEKQVAVEFEPDQGMRSEKDEHGRSLISFDIMETAYFNLGNPKSGLRSYANLDILQRIRDHILQSHLSAGDVARSAKLMADAAILVSLEHFIKGVVNTGYALAEFYSLAETIENQLGGRAKLRELVGKKDTDAVTSLANQNRFDQRHGPRDPANISPLPSNAVPDAAASAKRIILKYSETVL